MASLKGRERVFDNLKSWEDETEVCKVILELTWIQWEEYKVMAGLLTPVSGPAK